MSEAVSEHSGAGNDCCGGHGNHAAPSHDDPHRADAKRTVRDPVCGMSVDPATSKHRFEHKGETFHFCSAGCRTKFEADPAKYLEKKTTAPANVPAGTIYTCPMHPQIRQVGPGTCPICGMALEPEVASLEAVPNPELTDMTLRFWIGALLSVPPVVLEMGGHLAGPHKWIDPALSNWIQLVFATPVVLWAGWPFFVRGWQSLVTRNLNMFTLIAMGTGVAYAYSLIGTVAPQIFPATFRDHSGAVAVYFEAAAVITVLVLLGQVLELRARAATSGAIKALLQLAPKTARRVGDDDVDHEVEIDQLKVGNRLRVRPGEKVPVDGIILEGRSSLDESLVTGESMPVTRESNDKVIAGTLNQSGSFVMRADKVGSDTMLSRIVQMVAQAQRSRAPIQRMADQVAGWFVPAVIAIAVAAFAATPHGSLVVAPNAVTFTNSDLIVALAAQYRLPAIYPYASHAKAGGLISYGNDPAEQFRQAAGYVDRILRGVKLSDLPVQYPTKFQLLVNLKAAQGLGVDVPMHIQQLADEVIE